MIVYKGESQDKIICSICNRYTYVDWDGVLCISDKFLTPYCGTIDALLKDGWKWDKCEGCKLNEKQIVYKKTGKEKTPKDLVMTDEVRKEVDKIQQEIMPRLLGGYETDEEHGYARISSMGKFKLCPVEVLYWYDLSLNGMGEHIYRDEEGKSEMEIPGQLCPDLLCIRFELTEAECIAFNMHQEFREGKKVVAELTENSLGFVYLNYIISRE